MKTPTFTLFILCFIGVKCEQRISGGEGTSTFTYPFATSLLTNGGVESSFVHKCGGTILTTSAILSAASCFHTNGTLDSESWWQARVGSSLVASGGVIHFIRLITPHPEFSAATMDNDLAIVRTMVEINIQPGITDVAYIAGAVYALNTNQPIWAIGWGSISSSATSLAEQLQHVQFWVVDQTTCTNRYAELGFSVTPNMVCTGWLDVGIRGHCLGDAGSPLVDNGVVVGVNSWTAGECGDWGYYPSINTRINLYTRWIVATAIA